MLLVLLEIIKPEEFFENSSGFIIVFQRRMC